MQWLMIFVFIILNYGISNMIVYSNGPFHIFLHFRTWMENLHSQLGELMSCMICFPTYCGMFLSVVALTLGVSFTPFSIIFVGSYPLLTILFDGLFASGSTWLVHNIEEYFERSNVHYEDEFEKENVSDDVDGRTERN